MTPEAAEAMRQLERKPRWLWLKLWLNGVLGAPWACMFCGSAGPKAFIAWLLGDCRRPNKLHPCKSKLPGA